MHAIRNATPMRKRFYKVFKDTGPDPILRVMTMPALQTTIGLSELRDRLLAWLESRIARDPHTWLRETAGRLGRDAEDWDVFSSFSAVPRHTGKEPMKLSPAECQRAEAIRPGWKPATASTDEIGRTILLLALAERERTEFLDKFAKLLGSSDVSESIALYHSLPLLPHPEALTGWAAEGIRSNMTSVFNAVALDNPYPADFLDEPAWNQMLLKALFVGSPLYAIEGIDRRANPNLAHMLVEYAHERQAAGRSVSPALWRPVGPYAEGAILHDMEKILTHEDSIQRQAAALALGGSPSADAKELLNKYPEVTKSMIHHKPSWEWIEKQAAGT